ncbi:hypothetical protein F183_A01830 [Bryobacterales bacterium F-183]|nr:hypothetical protein F183_A01830 [Bryobacterales bacterium F-183]
MNEKALEQELMLPFELHHIPAHYRDYYRVKRGNFFATILRFEKHWRGYLLLDSAIDLSLNHCQRLTEPKQLLPLLLYGQAHAKIRIAFELFFSSCLGEGRSVMRDAVEFASIAHYMRYSSELQQVWLNRAEDPKAFEKEFRSNKKKKLFGTSPKLHAAWNHLSEIGAHCNIDAVADRLLTDDSNDRDLRVESTYLHTDLKTWPLSAAYLLGVATEIEDLIFSDFETRLQLVPDLVATRRKWYGYFRELKAEVKKSL